MRKTFKENGFLRRFHEGSGHKGKSSMVHALVQANMLEPGTRVEVENIIDSCNICKKYKRSMPRRKTTLPKVTHQNQIVTWDLKDWGEGYILWMIDSFSQFIKGVYVANKKMETIMEAMYYSWICNFGIPSEGFWTDNGQEFQNQVMK